jgi:YVTN family beta-propeller protein
MKALQAHRNRSGLAITPDGKRVYVLSCTNSCGTLVVEAIDVAARKVIATIPIGESMPVQSIAIIPGIPLSFTSKLFISQSKSYFELLSNITLGSGADWLNPVTDPVTIQVGSFAATIPPGSFKGAQYGPWTFDGTVNGAVIHSVIWLTGTKQYQVLAKVQQANIAGAKNPVTVRLTLGPNSGTAPVTGKIYAASANYIATL